MSDILIRVQDTNDLDQIAELYNERNIAAMTLQIPYTSASERSTRFMPTDSQRMLVAELDGVVVGHAGLTLNARRRSHVGSLGMSVDRTHQGRGVGTALLGALIDLADNWYNLRRLELEVYTDNEPGIRLYRRFGFVIEGTHRAYAYRDGAWADAYSMARLRDEPRVRRAEAN